MARCGCVGDPLQYITFYVKKYKKPLAALFWFLAGTRQTTSGGRNYETRLIMSEVRVSMMLHLLRILRPFEKQCLQVIQVEVARTLLCFFYVLAKYQNNSISLVTSQYYAMCCIIFLSPVIILLSNIVAFNILCYLYYKQLLFESLIQELYCYVYYSFYMDAVCWCTC